VRDVGSLNGTYLNRERIEEGALRVGDEVQVGKFRLVFYAGKAFLSIAMAQLVMEEDAGLDLVSGGELYLAEKAGFPMDRVFFPGNNKSTAEVEAAARLGIGALVVDSLSEIELLRTKDFTHYTDAEAHAVPQVDLTPQ